MFPRPFIFCSLAGGSMSAALPDQDGHSRMTASPKLVAEELPADPLVADVKEMNPELWRSFARALGAEPREHRTIRGATGLDHEVESIAVDDKNKRVILVSSEHHPRIAALMQHDVQSTFPGRQSDRRAASAGRYPLSRPALRRTGWSGKRRLESVEEAARPTI